ncbi:LPXTG cell wall anchor domain-containing protein [Embleya sp. NPDC050493]|uniref:LPXTG cell wall anchor domain-containing protein n=1 Tax=Embleya sp. NPDC050493 TaxID=3363989 RepID=UPI0037909AF2
MKPLRVLVGAAVVAVPLCVLTPASSAFAEGTLPDGAVTVTFPDAVEYAGGWTEGTVRLKNPTGTPLTGMHPYLALQGASYDPAVPSSALVEVADGPGAPWKPLATRTIGEMRDVRGDLAPAAGLDIPAGYDHTWRVRVRLLQVSVEGPTRDLGVGVFVAKSQTPQGNYVDLEGNAGNKLRVAGLEASYVGLPKQIPADAKPHEFQVRITTRNKADWHLNPASFGLDLERSMDGTTACEAQIEVKDPQGAWHKVKNRAEGMVGGDVDIAKWATGPVDNKIIQARITIGGGYATPAAHEIGFGYYPGAGPNNYYPTAKFTTVAVPGAAKCAGDDSATPTTAPSTPATAAPVPPAQGRPELAETGDDDNTTTLIGVAGALALAAGAGTVFAVRRRRA